MTYEDCGSAFPVAERPDVFAARRRQNPLKPDCGACGSADTTVQARKPASLGKSEDCAAFIITGYCCRDCGAVAGPRPLPGDWRPLAARAAA